MQIERNAKQFSYDIVKKYKNCCIKANISYYEIGYYKEIVFNGDKDWYKTLGTESKND